LKEIKLSNGLVTLVDDHDYERVMAAGPWHAHAKRGRHTVYAYRHIRKPDGGGTTQQLPRFLLDVADPKTKVDHEDRNGLNNQRSNLRAATTSQNSANARKRSDGRSSPYRGVCWDRRYGKWLAGSAALEHFGEFANLNFPPEKTAVSDAVERAAC
jgi:hypothetical protein